MVVLRNGSKSTRNDNFQIAIIGNDFLRQKIKIDWCSGKWQVVLLVYTRQWLKPRSFHIFMIVGLF